MGTLLLAFDTKHGGNKLMENQTKCRCGNMEHAHLCMLRSNGLYDEIARITINNFNSFENNIATENEVTSGLPQLLLRP